MDRPQLTVLVVDDHELVRAGLRLLLESCLEYSVVEADSADGALRLLERVSVDVVLLDVTMPERDGLWALTQMRTLRPSVPVLMVSTFDDPIVVRTALDLGAAGFLLKEAAVHQLAEAIQTATERKGVYIHPIAAVRLLAPRPQSLGGELTSRERAVLGLLIEGRTNEEIAAELFITEKTVKTHLSGIFRKLGVQNRTQAATKALQDRLLVHTGPFGHVHPQSVP